MLRMDPLLRKLPKRSLPELNNQSLSEWPTRMKMELIQKLKLKIRDSLKLSPLKNTPLRTWLPLNSIVKSLMLVLLLTT